MIPSLRRRHEQIGRGAEDRDRREIPLHIEWQVGHERRVDREVSRRDDQQRGAVRRRATNRIDPDIAGAAGAVFDARQLPGARLIFLRQQAGPECRPARRARAARSKSSDASGSPRARPTVPPRRAPSASTAAADVNAARRVIDDVLRHGFSLLLEKRTARKKRSRPAIATTGPLRRRVFGKRGADQPGPTMNLKAMRDQACTEIRAIAPQPAEAFGIL